ncbi:MAG TPA: deoxyhypusine synthase [Phycisphaerae bacterium]|nr:deoxyhypusine synthase [Phycisphaerae bacterium]
MTSKQDLLNNPIEHIDITSFDARPMVHAMAKMAFSARDMARAAEIYEKMLRDRDCAVILCLAGSLISAGLKKTIVDLLRNNMVDAIVSTGANIVDQDFFEALGFRHYIAPELYKAGLHDSELREMHIDRIYDTFIDEDDLRICDETCLKIAERLDNRPYSSREFIYELGRYAKEQGGNTESIVQTAFEKRVPIFAPAFNDCSAGLGLVEYIRTRIGSPRMTIDSMQDFYELTQIKIKNPVTGLFMIGGGVPKNFTQDIVVAADILGADPEMHKYAVQITIADVRDGALSSSTLKEASSWGKVDTAYEQMVFSEATIAFPIIASAAYHGRGWEGRKDRRFCTMLDEAMSPATAAV